MIRPNFWLNLPNSCGCPVSELWELFSAALYDKFDLVLRLFADHDLFV